MTAHRNRPSAVPNRGSRRSALVAGIALAAIVAFAGAAAASTADSTAFGQLVDLTLAAKTGDVAIVSAAAPMVAGAAEPAYKLADGVGSFRYDAPLRLGTLIASGAITLDAGSQMPAVDDATSAVTVDNLTVDLAGRLTLNATSVSAGAAVVPEDGASCWGGTFGFAGASFHNATLGGSLLPLRINLPAEPEPNTVVFDQPGLGRVIVNEQVVEDGRLSVHAIHVELIALPIQNVGVLSGDLYVGYADASVGCGGADFGVSIADSVDPAAVGQAVEYTFTMTNDGPERALGGTVTIPLSPALDLLAVTPSQGSCSIAGGVITCALGDVRAGFEATIAMTATPVQSGAVLVCADARSVNDDVRPENNHAFQTTRVNGQAAIKTADLALAMTDSADPVFIFDTLVYTLTVRHDGPSAVADALLVDELPVGVNLQSVTTSRGQCSGIQPVMCNLGPMNPGQQAVVTITTQVWLGGTLVNTATVSSPTTDPDTGDNAATELTDSQDLPS